MKKKTTKNKLRCGKQFNQEKNNIWKTKQQRNSIYYGEIEKGGKQNNTEKNNI